MPSSVANWSPYSDYVQGGVDAGFRYMSGHFVLVSAGPPRLSYVGSEALVGAALAGGTAIDSIVFPIGLIQNVNLGSNMNLARFFELGSDRSYFIPGRTVPQLGMSRPMLHGPSLLRLMWAYYQDLLPPTIIGTLFPNVGAGAVPNPHNVKVPPGFENVFLNLASDLFKNPVGLMFDMKDSNEDRMATIYAEQVYATSHSWGVDSSGVVMQESVSLQCERLVPVATTIVGLYNGRELVP